MSLYLSIEVCEAENAITTFVPSIIIKPHETSQIEDEDTLFNCKESSSVEW